MGETLEEREGGKTMDVVGRQVDAILNGASWRWRSGRPLDEGRVTSASDVRLYALTNFVGGATGIFSPRWRPLRDRPFAGSFAFYEMDG